MQRNFILLFAFLLAIASAVGQDLRVITLKTLDGKVVKLSSFDKKLVAFVFLSPECPLSQNYALVLNELQEQNKGVVDVIGIFPGKSYLPQDYLAFKEKYKIRFTLLTDSSKKLVAKLGAKVTPEVFLVDAQNKVVYSGAIDNWVIDLGKKRNKATVHFLASAITSYSSGKAVGVVHTQAIGCYISDL